MPCNNIIYPLPPQPKPRYAAPDEYQILSHKEKAPLVIVNTFQGDGSEIYTALRSMTDRIFCLAVISDIDWDDEMSPWDCPPLYRNDSPCTGGADKYLNKLTDIIIPAIKNELANQPEYIAIAGYSLSSF